MRCTCMPALGRARAAAALAVARAARPHRAAAQRRRADQGGVVSDIGGLNDKGSTSLALKGFEQAKDELGVDGRVYISKSAGGLRAEPHCGGAGGYDLVIARRLPARRTDRRVAKKFPDTNFAIIDYSVRSALKAQAEERARPNARVSTRRRRRATSSACWRRRWPKTRQRSSTRRRHEDPAGRHLDRGLPALREEGRTRTIKVAQRLLAGLRRLRRSARRSRSTRSRSGSRRRLPGRRRLRPRRARRREARRAAGASASTPTSLPRRRRPHERAEARRLRVFDDDQAGEGRHVQGRRRRCFNVKNDGIGVGKISPTVPRRSCWRQ